MTSVLPQVWSFLKTLAIAAFLAFFVIRGFLVEPFRIPSSSMLPTLEIGDYLVVSKFAYGNRLPLTDFFFWEREPERGDIVVFRREDSGLPGSFFGFGSTLFIKRLVGLPGDTIAYRDQTLWINEEPVAVTPLGPYPLVIGKDRVVEAQLAEETLPGDPVTTHPILHVPGAEGPTLPPTVIPAGRYVLMGDNRDNSRDSRFWNYPAWGYVPKEDLMGRAEFVVWSWDEDWRPRLERIFLNLRRHGAE